MLFSSYIFIFAFLPASLLGFFILSSRPGGERWAKAWLGMVSLVYYRWWNPVYVGLIAVSMLFNFGLGKVIWRVRADPVRGGALMGLGVAANLALLCYYKYANFFVDTLGGWLGTGWHVEKLILPLGISFFTFQQVAYLVDARRGVACEGKLVEFVLFITFFPHSIAGPIVHHTEMMPQFARPATYRFRWENQAVGLTLFALGLFKKVIIADGLSGHAGTVFGAAAAGQGLHASDAWAGVLSYTFQIYFDFSGYSDMALGLGRMFGIVLPLNFNSPYKAVDLIDFWRRWHITLSRFLRDYIYIPLGGNRHGPMRRYLNLLLTMLLGGLWHGAGWTFLAWGALHGLGLALNHLMLARWPTMAAAGPGREATRWIGRILTLLLVTIGWVFFRASHLPAASHLLGAMLGLGPALDPGAAVLLKSKLWFWLAGLLALVWFTPNACELTREAYPALLAKGHHLDAPPGWLQWRPQSGWAFATALLLAVAILSLTNAGEFLYYNF